MVIFKGVFVRILVFPEKICGITMERLEHPFTNLPKETGAGFRLHKKPAGSSPVLTAGMGRNGQDLTRNSPLHHS